MFEILLTVALAQSPSFAEAKSDASKRPAYLEQLLGKLVYDKAKNPQGLVRAWYATAQTHHAGDACRCNACGLAAVRAEYKAQGREFFFDKEIKGVLSPLETQNMKILPFYREGAIFGSPEHAGVLLVGDVFALRDEEELRSVLDDYAGTYLAFRELGLKIKDRELDVDNLRVRWVSHYSMIHMHALSVQLENIVKGTRKVSDAFKEDVKKQYLSYLQKFYQHVAKEEEIYNDNNDNLLQKETVEALQFVRKELHSRFDGLGVKHKVTDPKTFQATLEGIK